MVARALLLVLMAGACGRFSFEPVRGGDAGMLADGSGSASDTTMVGSDALGDPWWDPAWQRRIRLSIADQGQPLTAFPLMVRLDATRLSYVETQNAGQDLRFVAADHATVLAHEIEVWNESGESYVWVHVPLITGADAHIWLYYGNPSAGAAQNPSAVWSGYGLVWHLVESPTAAAPQMRDSTGNGNAGTATGGMPAGTQMAGVVGGSLGFDGNNDWITGQNSASLRVTGDVTIAVWINRAQTGRNEWLCDFTTPQSESESNNHLYELSVDTTNQVELEWEYGSGSDEAVGSTVGISTGAGTWTWIAVTRDVATNTVRFYQNGAQLGAAVNYTNDPTGGTTATLWLGGMVDSSSSKQPLLGRVDELRIESAVRSPAWLSAQYRSMTDMMITYGAPQMF